MERQVIQPAHWPSGAVRCTATDAAVRFIHGGAAFFYPERLDSQRLAAALAQVLVDFPGYAGRLCSKGDALYIEPGSGGVTFEVVHTEARLEALLEAARAGRLEALHPKIARSRVMNGTEALTLIRLTNTPDGCVLGVVENHCVGDMHSLMLLIHAWALAYRGLPYDKPLAPLDRDAYLHEHAPDPASAESSVAMVSSRQFAAIMLSFFRRSRRVHLDFSGDRVAALRAAVGPAKSVTAADAVAAQLFWTIRKLQGATLPTNLCRSVNYRKRVGLPANLLGNAVTMIGQPVGDADSPAQIALGLRAQLERFATQYFDYHSNKRALAAHPGRFQRMRLFPKYYQPGRGHLLISSLAGSGIHDLIFESARPLHVASLTPLWSWSALLYESANNAGLSVALALPPKLAARLVSPEGRELLFGTTHGAAPAVSMNAVVSSA